MQVKSMTVDTWLHKNSEILADAMIPSARLDAEIILAHTLRRGRTWLHAHGDHEIDQRLLDILNARMQLRLERVPVAYIVGHKEFYGRLFDVRPGVLIPRPESEAIITLLKGIVTETSQTLIDVGTGSGGLGITAKLEFPQLDVTLTDIDKLTLTIAERNAKKLGASVATLKSNLLTNYPLLADIIIANLPYVDQSWDVSQETAHEPELALYARDNGLALIKKLIDQAPSHLSPGGYLLLESDLRQHGAIEAYARQHGFTLRNNEGLIQVYQPE